ncbi:hypothetical protein [Nodularia sp. UHCC 0506]|uniref:hypothetical protein n=1 Tax=Nodularia sp. UHCC 0506 TaxID=3110243 RepID=UPI002B1EC35F|nr:hypothetical protein [Nodularia sp. UHCC 0506]MEA5514361.1 hypothetical protein [Nodularia sp. UHCC 0506]
MTKLIWFPVVASAVIIGYADHLAISRKPKNYMEMALNSSETVVELDEPTAINFSQTTSKIDEKTALDLVWQLPLVQRKAREIKYLSKGTIEVAAIVYDYPTPNDPYYKVRVFDGEPKHDTTIYWFRVLNTGDVIEVLDVIDNKYISLDEWREQLKP